MILKVPGFGVTSLTVGHSNVIIKVNTMVHLAVLINARLGCDGTTRSDAT
ncbi:hypothetical protein [Petrachloros mirabilis]